MSVYRYINVAHARDRYFGVYSTVELNRGFGRFEGKQIPEGTERRGVTCGCFEGSSKFLARNFAGSGTASTVAAAIVVCKEECTGNETNDVRYVVVSRHVGEAFLLVLAHLFLFFNLCFLFLLVCLFYKSAVSLLSLSFSFWFYEARYRQSNSIPLAHSSALFTRATLCKLVSAHDTCSLLMKV